MPCFSPPSPSPSPGSYKYKLLHHVTTQHKSDLNFCSMNKITIHSTSWDKSFSLISYTRFCLSLNSFIFIKQTSPLKLKFKSPNFHAFTLFHHLMLHWLSKSQVFVSSCSYICLIVNSKSKSEYFLVYPLYIRYGDDDIEKCSLNWIWVGYFWWNVPSRDMREIGYVTIRNVNSFIESCMNIPILKMHIKNPLPAV